MKTIQKIKLRVKPPLSLLFIVVAILAWSCYPDGGFNSVSDFDTVSTFHNTTVNFADLRTYAMPDSVIHIEDEEDLSRLFDQEILARVAANLEQLGYVRVDSAQADVHVFNLATSTEYVGSSCYPPYWDYWYGYPPGWGWCYPVVSSYTTGTLLTVMIDTGQPDDTPAVWLAASNGLLSSSGVASERIRKNINQAFAQSPYLGDGK